MYCMKCGVRLQDTEKKCPLCGFSLPEISPIQKGTYPSVKRPRDREDFRGLLLFVTLILFGAGGAVFAADMILGGGVTFSGLVLFSLLLFYAAFLLPRWFRRPNPVVFLPIFCLCLGVFLFYLDFFYGNGWFFPFALPLLGGVLILLETVITLARYVHKGYFYIYGGFFLGLGVLSLVGEILYRAYAHLPVMLTWSLIPLIFFSLVGLGLIVIAIVRPFRAFIERRFFV